MPNRDDSVVGGSRIEWGRMSKSNRPRHSAQNGDSETKTGRRKIRKREKETGSPPFEIPSHIIPEKPWTYGHGNRDKREESMVSAAVSALGSRLFPMTETGKRKSRNRPCPRGLRLKTKKPAAVVDFAGLLKWGGGAVRGESVQILQHLLCGLIRTQMFSKEGAENDSVLEYEDGKRGNKLNMPHSGYSTKTSPFQEETPLCGSIPPGERGRRAGGVFHVLRTMAKVPMPPFSSRGGMISGIRRGA